MNEENVREMIDKILNTVGGMFEIGRKTNQIDNAFPILCDLSQLFEKYSDMNAKDCGRIIIKRYIKLLNLIITLETDPKRRAKYLEQLENAYKLAGRVSLEHFIIYYEWDWNKEDRVLEPRYNILKSYVYYLNKMCFDEDFEGMIVNLPSRIWKKSYLQIL